MRLNLQERSSPVEVLQPVHLASVFVVLMLLVKCGWEIEGGPKDQGSGIHCEKKPVHTTPPNAWVMNDEARGNGWSHAGGAVGECVHASDGHIAVFHRDEFADYEVERQLSGGSRGEKDIPANLEMSMRFKCFTSKLTRDLQALVYFSP